MPQSHSYSSKRAPSHSNKSAKRLATPDMSPKMKALSQSKKGSNARPTGHTAFERKRRASSSSVSSVSSVSSLEEMSEGEDSSEDDADDEEDRPLAKASSYGRRRKNNARKAGRQPMQNKRRRISDDEDSDQFGSAASDSDDSSDDIYAAVDYITDADDEEQDVEKLEEMMIMQSEVDHRFPPSTGTQDDWQGAEIFGDSMMLPAASFFDDEQLYSAMDNFGETDMASEAVETPVAARRVHFEERSDSSSDSDSHTEDEIPSDFLQQDSLDPQLRRMIESDTEHHRSHRRQSEEIFGDADYGHGNIYHVDSEGTSEGSLSGYESMLATLIFSFVSLLTYPQPTMATLLTKTSPHLPLSLILDPFFAETRRTLWSPPTTKQTTSPVVAAQSWELLRPILTSLLLWSTVPASISLSSPPMLLPAMTG